MYTKIKNYIRNNKGSALFALLLLIIWGTLNLVSNNSWFQASILNMPKSFDGTVMPIAQVPNTLTWTGDHYTDLFSSIDEDDLITIPEYDAEELLIDSSDLEWGDEDDNLIRIAQTLYSVVYLGNYELDHQENVGSHLAVDIRIPQGTPIQAIANGTVVWAYEKSSGFGHYIVIKHTDVPDYPDSSETTTLYSGYAHLSTLYVEEGDVVEKGDIIALSGETGTATTPHLHFQIDKESAPWHLYWPFTTAEATSAGYTFFEAINAGLNKSKATKYTVSPMLWVQDNLNYNLIASGGSSDSDDEEEDSELAEFEIEADKTSAYTGGKIQLTITALNEDGDVLEDYEPSDDFSISADSGSSRYLRTLTFEDGVSTLSFTDVKEKDVVVTIAEGEIEESIELSFEEAPEVDPDELNILVSESTVEQGAEIAIVIEALNDDEVVTTYEPSDDFVLTVDGSETSIEFEDGVGELSLTADEIGAFVIEVEENDLSDSLTITVEEADDDEEEEDDDEEEDNDDDDDTETTSGIEVYSLEIIGESLGLVGSPVTLVVKAYDEDGNLIKNFVPAEEITVETDGKGTLEPEELDEDNFVNGVATISYLTSEEEEIEIEVGEESFEISFIAEIKQLAAFEVTHDGYFIVGMPETITIQAIDEDENATSYTSIGTVKLTLVDGEGTFEPEKLTANDFNSGKAEISFTAITEDSVKIKAQNGAIVGISRYLNADEDGIFSDVDADHEFAEAIAYLKDAGIISGYDDGSFKPDNNVSRVEALKMIIGALSIELADNTEIDFPDTESPSWYATYVATALEESIVAGYPDGTFRPSNKIIRSEYLKVLLEAANVELNDEVDEDPYDDVEADAWYATYAEFCKENDLFETEDDELLPSQNVTRGEVADTLYKIIQILS